MVLLGEMRHPTRTLLTFTRPYFGTASSMSNTLAVSMNSGGSSRRSWIEVRPAFRSRLSWARRVRIVFARANASIRCCSDLSGAATEGFVGVLTAGGTGGESTQPKRPYNRFRPNSPRPQVEVEEHRSRSSVFARFAGPFGA